MHWRFHDDMGPSLLSKLQTLLATGAKLELGDIHEHWNLAKKTALQPNAAVKAKDELPNVLDLLTNTFSELPDFQQAATVDQI
ncbi:hypothetical protein PsorP6_013861 [Peronosclerospora sorghi]|uniref:Uncharacterized protein n=1 Tax=Peronosclerospora sorghi TaxID=230839 RepID=A0ACC0VH31_9STRA|nr:hypothetical protein PsorP6_013861 [Peronosclerospora sorghi]